MRTRSYRYSYGDCILPETQCICFPFSFGQYRNCLCVSPITKSVFVCTKVVFRRFRAEDCHLKSRGLCEINSSKGKSFPECLIQYAREGSGGRGRARSEPGGTRCRTGGEVKGKLANGVGSQYSHATSERGLSSITQADAHTSAASSRLN